jgi:aldehyde dehydrogenase (NAD+)
MTSVHQNSTIQRHAEAAAQYLPNARIVIGSDERDAGSGGIFEHINPVTGQAQAEVPLGGASEIDEAVRAARQALPTWRGITSAERRDILIKFADLVRNYESWVPLQVLENGQTSIQANSMTQAAYGWMSYYASWADRLEGTVTRNHPDEGLVYTFTEPHGVVAMIITWNAPLLSLSMKLSPALAAGNTIVLKPAEFTPFTAMVWLDLARQAGIPDGVINIVPGGVDAGEALVKHPDVDKISFTGGPNTARSIMRGAADQLTPVLFELGGKGANLVFEDADLDEAIPFSCAFGMANTGQACAIPTRLLVQRTIYDEVIGRVEAIVGSMKVGDPLDPDTYIGPLVNRAAIERVQGVVDHAVATRAGRLLLGGSRVGGELADGFFMEPTVFVDVDPASDIAQHEIFGPVLSVIPFDSEDEAVSIANSTAYGLTNYVQTPDSRRVNRVVRALNSGSIGVNAASCLHVSAPFGGNGLSGFGREGGKAGIDEFVRTKTVIQR